MELVLASTSIYRHALMQRLGVPFRVVSPAVDESQLRREFAGLEPAQVAERLAEAKASFVAESSPDAAVIGCDQLIDYEGAILGKPGTRDGAIEQLKRLSGRTHLIHTALTVTHRKAWYRHTDTARLTMRPLSSESLERYVDVDRPLDCAGSYKLEEHGIVLFERIESIDESAIHGLPLIALTTILRVIGFDVP